MAEREVFWNIAHTWLFYVLAALSVFVFIAGCYRNLYAWFTGWPIQGTANWPLIFRRVLKDVFGNVKIFLGDLFGGLTHLFIMWGFFVLFLGTVLLASHEYLFTYLRGSLFEYYELVLDVFGLLFVVGLVMAIVRRYVLKAGKMNNLTEDVFILLLLLTIGITGFLIEGFRLAADPKPWMNWSPVGAFLASFLGGETKAWHLFFWWTHVVLSLLLIAYIPFSKLFHLIAGSVTVALDTLPSEVLTLEEREKVKQDFGQKHIIGMDACTRCNRCENKCPSHLSGELLSPRGINQKVKAYVKEKYGFPRLVNEFLKKPVSELARETVMSGEEPWMCTTCRACVEECPITINSLDLIRQMRALKVEEGTQVPTMVGETLESVFKYGNPYQGQKNKRMEWTKDLEIKNFSKGESAELLYFVGCGPSYDSRLQEIARSAVRVFTALGLDFGILGNKESCCGDVAKRTGEDGLLEEVVTKNYELFEEFGIKEIVTTCPHGLKMFRDEYPLYKEKLAIETEDELKVQHYTQLLAHLIKEGKLRFSKELKKRVTYHDPCYLGRHCGIFDPPREIIKAIPGVQFVEMKRNRRDSFCCGGGGGRLWMEEFEAKEKISEIRVRDAAEVQAQILITACPFCMSMLEDAVKTAGYEKTMGVKDILELLVDLL
ncbi:MAG: (Fe-S)-binding protein [Pseudomonadota bacterium]